jgi:hypothetical protein
VCPRAGLGHTQPLPGLEPLIMQLVAQRHPGPSIIHSGVIICRSTSADTGPLNMKVFLAIYRRSTFTADASLLIYPESTDLASGHNTVTPEGV